MLIAIDVFTGQERELLRVERYISFGFALSPDGNELAYSVRIADRNAGVPDTEIRVVDLATMSDRTVGAFGGEPFEQFSGTATLRAWRDDGWLSIVGAKQKSGAPTGFARLNTANGEKVFNEPGFSFASPRGRWLVYADINGVGTVYRDPQRIRIIDPLTNAEVERLEDPDQCSVPLEWAPDGSELLVKKYASDPIAEPAFPCDTSRYSYSLVTIGRSSPAPVTDLSSVWRRWYGERLIEVLCSDGVAGDREPDCRDSVIQVNGRDVGSGDYIRVLGWIEP